MPSAADGNKYIIENHKFAYLHSVSQKIFLWCCLFVEFVSELHASVEVKQFALRGAKGGKKTVRLITNENQRDTSNY
jgi:hypothetical protein